MSNKENIDNFYLFTPYFWVNFYCLPYPIDTTSLLYSYWVPKCLFAYVCQIVHWKNHLKFPEEVRLSPEAKDLISRLLCDVEHRLGTGGSDQIKVLFYFLFFTINYTFQIQPFSLTYWFLSWSGSSLVQRYCMGQTIWDGGSI